MTFMGDKIYVALARTPDYTIILGVAADKSDAKSLLRGEYGGCVMEVDLAQVLNVLQRAGLEMREVWP